MLVLFKTFICSQLNLCCTCNSIMTHEMLWLPLGGVWGSWTFLFAPHPLNQGSMVVVLVFVHAQIKPPKKVSDSLVYIQHGWLLILDFWQHFTLCNSHLLREKVILSSESLDFKYADKIFDSLKRFIKF